MAAGHRGSSFAQYHANLLDVAVTEGCSVSFVVLSQTAAETAGRSLHVAERSRKPTPRHSITLARPAFRGRRMNVDRGDPRLCSTSTPAVSARDHVAFAQKAVVPLRAWRAGPLTQTAPSWGRPTLRRSSTRRTGAISWVPIWTTAVQSFRSLLGNPATYSRIQAATALNENYVFTPYSRATQTHRAPSNCSA